MAASGGSQHSDSATGARETACNQSRRDGAPGGQGGASRKENRVVSKLVSGERRWVADRIESSVSRDNYGGP